MSFNCLTAKLPLAAAATLGVFALSACSADEIPSGQLASMLEEHTSVSEAQCTEDLVLSDGEQVACDFDHRAPGDMDQPLEVAFNEEEHALQVDNPVVYLRSTIELDEEDNTALSAAPDDGDYDEEYYRESIPADELEEMLDERLELDGQGLREEGEEPREEGDVSCDGDLDTSFDEDDIDTGMDDSEGMGDTEDAHDGPVCTVNGSDFEVLMESDTDVLFQETGFGETSYSYNLVLADAYYSTH